MFNSTLWWHLITWIVPRAMYAHSPVMKIVRTLSWNMESTASLNRQLSWLVTIATSCPDRSNARAPTFNPSPMGGLPNHILYGYILTFMYMYTCINWHACSFILFLPSSFNVVHYMYDCSYSLYLNMLRTLPMPISYVCNAVTIHVPNIHRMIPTKLSDDVMMTRLLGVA